MPSRCRRGTRQSCCSVKAHLGGTAESGAVAGCQDVRQCPCRCALTTLALSLHVSLFITAAEEAMQLPEYTAKSADGCQPRVCKAGVTSFLCRMCYSQHNDRAKSALKYVQGGGQCAVRNSGSARRICRRNSRPPSTLSQTGHVAHSLSTGHANRQGFWYELSEPTCAR